MALSWRKRIDNAIHSKMDSRGFRLVVAPTLVAHNYRKLANFRNLNSLIPEWSLRLTRDCREDEIAKVTDAVVEIVVDIGLPLARRFDSIHSIIQELDSPSDLQMRGQRIHFKLPLAYMLTGQLDKSQQSLIDFDRKLREQDSLNIKSSRPLRRISLLR